MFLHLFSAVEFQQVTAFAEKWPRMASTPAYLAPSELRRSGTVFML